MLYSVGFYQSQGVAVLKIIVKSFGEQSGQIFVIKEDLIEGLPSQYAFRSTRCNRLHTVAV